MSAATNTKAIMALLFVGVLMGALDLAIIGPALPAIQKEFGLDNRDLSWLFNVYVLAQLIGTPLLAKLSGHVVMVGKENPENRTRLEAACKTLTDKEHQVEAHLVQGEVNASLMDFQERYNIELKVMGAYGHSRIRDFIVGSNTTKMLATSTVPVLILR